MQTTPFPHMVPPIHTDQTQGSGISPQASMVHVCSTVVSKFDVFIFFQMATPISKWQHQFPIGNYLYFALLIITHMIELEL